MPFGCVSDQRILAKSGKAEMPIPNQVPAPKTRTQATCVETMGQALGSLRDEEIVQPSWNTEQLDSRRHSRLRSGRYFLPSRGVSYERIAANSGEPETAIPSQASAHRALRACVEIRGRALRMCSADEGMIHASRNTERLDHVMEHEQRRGSPSRLRRLLVNRNSVTPWLVGTLVGHGARVARSGSV